MRSKIQFAVAAILAGGPVVAAETAAESDSGGLAEVTVTAQRRTENIQDVPIAMQALTAQGLQQLNVSTFDEYLKFLPNITSANNGPGQNEVFMRGLSAGSQASQGSSATGLWPNVAIYLDNQSVQMPNRNLDVYTVDLDRIEVLEGPQGTLFGAGAQAGVIRYITNQPKLDKFEGYVKGGYGVTAHGDPNTDVQMVLNVPILADHLGVRAVIYNDRRGGYIDNVPATFTRHDSDYGIHYAQYATGCSVGAPVGGVCASGTPTAYGVPPGSPTLNNYNIARNAINPATYQGARAEALFRLNDDWDFLVTQSYQTLNTDGVFYQQPLASDGYALQPLQVTLFNDAYAKDRFESTAWTLNGKLGPLKAVYTGGYLARNVEQTGDYTNYVRGVYADYYQCYGPGSGGDTTLKSTCFSPSAFWKTNERNHHQQHEFRLSTPDEWRIRGIVGAFWEDNQLKDKTSWHYKSVPACSATVTTGCLANIGTIPGTTVDFPGLQSNDTSFNQDETRDTRQLAFFLSGDFDIIPKVLTVTAGTRHFKFDNVFTGTVGGSFGCFEATPYPDGCHNYLPYAQPPFVYNYNLDAQNLRGSESGFKSRANLTWHVTPDVMLYYTWSQGYRPGGFNQNGLSPHAPGTDGVDQYLIPRSWNSDNLTNNEIGWKTEWFDRHLQWNGAVYRENWDNVQISFFNPGLVGNLFYNTNGQNFRINGVETSFVARPFAGLTLQGSAAWNSSKQTNSPNLIDNNPASNNYGKQITQVCDTTGANCSQVTNPFGPVGSPSANAPPIQFSARARYDWSLASGWEPFVQVSMTHSGHSFTQAGANPNYNIGGAVSTSRGRFENPAYTTYDASAGLAKDAWLFTVYCENLSNSNASVFVSTDQFIVAQTPLRPRIIEVSASYRF